ncbi:MAG TPA: carboxypeptidase regulatory-like domain-containing protein, partial [Blastocatellia bacterium]|nr:carboxypeptidase regulatory-like domain-containing protein [Blastocatellia bacterium]
MRRKVWLRLAGCALSVSIAGAGLAQAQPQSSFQVSGVVFDQSNAVIAGANVELRQSGRALRTTDSDQEGRFRFTRLESGNYEIEVRKEGFKTGNTQLSVGPRAPAPMRIVLKIAEVREEMAVGEHPNRVSTNPDDNLNVTKLDRDNISKLPILGNDIIASVAILLDSASVGSSGPTIIVDGLERPRKKLPASTIQEIRINQNPYSAEFSRPGRGRIEVTTKAGSHEFHGEADFLFRDHRLDARNSFALERPPEQRRNFDGNVTGPVGHGKKTSFLFAFAREEEDLQAVVFAQTPAGVVSENVATPTRDTELSLRIDHQPDKKTSLSVRYEFNFDSTVNGGVGGYNLPEVATNSAGREHQLFVTHRRTLSHHLINEFSMRLGRDAGSTESIRPRFPKLIVLDAFAGGGGQTDRHATEYAIQFNEILSWSSGNHYLKAGMNVPGINRRVLSDRSNFGGTFSFSTLDDYQQKRPYLFVINQGDPDLTFWQKDIGLFVQDNVQLQPNFSVGLGMRYDWQNHLGDNNNLAARLSF